MRRKTQDNPSIISLSSDFLLYMHRKYRDLIFFYTEILMSKQLMLKLPYTCCILVHLYVYTKYVYTYNTCINRQNAFRYLQPCLVLTCSIGFLSLYIYIVWQ